jgi:hypothetical protein
MGFRDDLAASKARVRQLEAENAKLRAALEDESPPALEEQTREREAPSTAEYVAAAFITLTPSVAFYASMVRWLPWTQPEAASESDVAGLVGAAATALTALLFLCPAVLAWKWSDGRWVRVSSRERVSAAAMGVGFIVFLAIVFLFTDGAGV